MGTPNNTYEILKEVLNEGTLSTYQVDNTYDCFKAVHNTDEDALNVNVTNLAEATEASVKDAAFKVNTISYSGDVITPDGDNNINFFDVYLDRADTRINLPINIREGELYRFQIRNDMYGNRAVHWGNKDTFTGLNVSINSGMGNTVIFYINSGTFDWSTIHVLPGRNSYLDVDGFTNNENNMKGLKITAYDESSNTITCQIVDWDITNENNATGISINIKNPFYFMDEMGDSWIGQFPFGVTQFTFYSTSGGESGLLKKEGVYKNILYQRAKVRFEEELTDDFVNGSDDGLLNWREANSNGNTTVSSADVDGNHIGILYQRLNSGAAADGRTSTTLGSDQFLLEDLRADISGIIKPNSNAFSTADVKYYFGWSDSNQWNSTTDGFYFEIIADGSGNGRVWCVGELSNTRTTYDTGIDLVEDEWYIFNISKPANGGNIYFTINDITIYEMAQSVIGIDKKLTCGFGSYYDYTGTPLPDHKEWFIDAFSLKYRMGSDRI